MMNKRVAVFLLAMLVGINAQDMCHTCELMVNDCRAKFNNNFDNVSDADLTAELNDLCKKYFSGFEAALCPSLLDPEEKTIMTALRIKDPPLTSYECCQCASKDSSYSICPAPYPPRCP